MTIKHFSISVRDIHENKRLEPRYYGILKLFKDVEKNSKYKLIELGNKELLKKITDGEHAGQIFVEKGVRFLKNSSVRDFTINMLDNFFITEEKHKKQKRSALKPYDILFTTIGHLGSASIVPKDFGEANINQNIVKMEINSEIINPFFLTVYLNSIITKKQIFSLFTGNIHSILTYPKIKSIKIIIPTKEFEKTISNKYEKAIKLETEAMSLINLALNNLFNYLDLGNYIENESLSFKSNILFINSNDLWTPKFSYPNYINASDYIKSKFDVIDLGKVVGIKSGDEVGSDNYIKYIEKKDLDIPFIRTSDLVNYDVDQFTDFYIPQESYDYLKQDLQEGDILYTKDGKIGDTALVTKNDKVIISSGITRLRINNEGIKNNLTSEYVFAVLALKETGKFPAIRRTVIASTIPHLREDRLGEFEIPLLNKSEIDKITEIIKNAFILKNEKKGLINEIKNEVDLFYNF